VALVELICICVCFLFYLIGIIVWASCLSTSESYTESIYDPDIYTITPVGTGYGYLVFCFMLMIAGLVHSIVIRNDPYYIAMGREQLMANSGAGANPHPYDPNHQMYGVGVPPPQ